MSLEARQLRLDRGGSRALDEVGMTVRPGELVALLGPNGAGKTSLLQCCAGALLPSAGEVRLDGTSLRALPRRELARRRAVLSQRPSVPGQLRLEELVAFGRLPHRGTGPARREREIVAAAIEEMGLGRLVGRACGTLSGGELQRAHMARVLAQLRRDDADPGGCLLLDEPTANLDPAYQRQILARARACADAGLVVLAVLHDFNEAAMVADRIVLMAAGRVVATGTPEEVLRPDLIRRVYGIETIVWATRRPAGPSSTRLARPDPDTQPHHPATRRPPHVHRQDRFRVRHGEEEPQLVWLNATSTCAQPGFVGSLSAGRPPTTTRSTLAHGLGLAPPSRTGRSPAFRERPLNAGDRSSLYLGTRSSGFRSTDVADPSSHPAPANDPALRTSHALAASQRGMPHTQKEVSLWPSGKESTTI